jgi:quercetin 2,3-dioxygenase
MIERRPFKALTGDDLGWLKAKHHFAFGAPGDRSPKGWGTLRIWNDDEIAPNAGFPLHAHANMEIITYVREGAVTHRDNLGNEGRTQAGDVQVMSAGTGIRHAEQNKGTEPLRLFQIWIKPRENGGAPRWDTRRFPKADRANQLVVLASGLTEDEGALPIRANARVLGATLMAGAEVRYELGSGRSAYLAPTQGSVNVNGRRLNVGDGIAAANEPELVIAADENAEFVLVDAA